MTESRGGETRVYEISEDGSEAISVSRERAKRYESYDLWYRNKDNLFADLGKFMGNTVQVPGRIGQVLGTAGARSSVENLRNPCHRIVEFYATVLFSGDPEQSLPLQIESEGDDADQEGGRAERSSSSKLKAAILKVWESSNLAQTKQVLKRYTALYGQCFIKVVSPASTGKASSENPGDNGKRQCYLQFIRPQHVTAFEADQRSNISYIRLDVPDVENAGAPNERQVWRSEVWSKDKQEAVFSTAERRSADTVPSEKALREATGAKVVSFEDTHGADFVPFVVVNAADTGEDRPPPVYENGLHLIAWINREATRLSDLMFRYNKAHKAIVGIGNDSSGRPMAPPRPEGVRDLGQVHAEQEAANRGEHTVPFGGSRGAVLSREHDDISIDGVAVIGLPGNAQVVDVAPNISYEAARQWISDHIREIYEECPELLYYAVEARANQSGYALRTLIAGAVSRAEEMRDNILSALAKADKMALTVAQVAGLEGFASAEIGTYEAGGFEHSFEPSEILPQTEDEREEAASKKTQNAQSLMGVLTQLGIPREKQREVVLKELGYEELANEAMETAEGSTEPPEIAEGGASDRDAARAALERRLSGAT